MKLFKIFLFESERSLTWWIPMTRRKSNGWKPTRWASKSEHEKTHKISMQKKKTDKPSSMTMNPKEMEVKRKVFELTCIGLIKPSRKSKL